MAEYSARFQVAGVPDGDHWNQLTELTVRQTLTFGVDPGGSPAVVAQPAGLMDMELVEVVLGPLAAAGVPAGVITRLTTGGRSLAAAQTPDLWFIEQTASQNYFDNGSACLRYLLINPPGIFVNQPIVVLGGLALAEFATPPTTVDAILRYRPRYFSPVNGAGTNPSARRLYSLQQGMIFVNTLADPPESTTDLTTWLRRLERSMNNTPGSVLLGSGERLYQCSYAAIDPRGIVWIAPGDLGVGVGQIPSSVAANTGAAYLNHPGAFWANDRAATSRTWESVNVNASAVDSYAGSVTIALTQFTVAASRWLFIIDGAPLVVILRHGDLRRPKDIWRQIITPMINQSGQGRGPIFWQDTISGGNRTLAPLGVMQDLTRLQYAQFLEPLSASAADVSTIWLQNP